MENSVMQQRINGFKTFGETLKGAKVYFREVWEVLYFDLPEKNEELREIYSGTVIPGYYTNKNHWNSIKLASDELSDDAIQQLIETSYQLVYQKLTKKQKAEIEA